MIFSKVTTIPFGDFMSQSVSNTTPILERVIDFLSVGYTTFYDLPLLEGIVGFGMLGVVLLVLSQLEDRVNQKVVNGTLLTGFLVGLLLLLFKSMSLVGL